MKHLREYRPEAGAEYERCLWHVHEQTQHLSHEKIEREGINRRRVEYVPLENLDGLLLGNSMHVLRKTFNKWRLQ